MRAAASTSATHLIFCSSIAVYGSARHGTSGFSTVQLIDEDTALNPQTAYAKSKVIAETLVISAVNRELRPIGTVLRLAAVYGPHIKGNYFSLVKALARGRFLPIGAGINRRTLIFETDVARAIGTVIASPAAAGALYNLTDGECYEVSSIIDSICAALGRRVPRVHIPARPLRSVCGLVDALGWALLRRRWTFGMRLDKYLEDIAVSSVKFHSAFNFVPLYRLREGWSATVAALRMRRSI